MKYGAIIEKDEDGFMVSFPDLDGCLTDGDTLEEAKANAEEILNAFLETLLEDNIEFLLPSRIKGDNVYYIPVNKQIEFSINLIKERKELNLT